MCSALKEDINGGIYDLWTWVGHPEGSASAKKPFLIRFSSYPNRHALAQINVYQFIVKYAYPTFVFLYVFEEVSCELVQTPNQNIY